MNQQPLELYDQNCLGGYSLKLLNRNYLGPLIQIHRHADDVKVDVKADAVGVVSLNSQIEVNSGNTNANTLEEFLQETEASNFGLEIFYDQSSNYNNLYNTDINTQPLIAINSNLVESEWGISINTYNKFLNITNVQQTFSAHYKIQFDNVVGVGHFFKQPNNAVYTKITNLYLDEAVGANSTTVFLNETYYSDYTTKNIPLEADSAYLITLECDIDENLLELPNIHIIENVGLVHTILYYEDINDHVRRHKTNQMLSEDIPELQNKLKKFNPNSYFNLIPGATAAFAALSFGGIITNQNIKLFRAIRDKIIPGRAPSSSQIDIIASTSGYVNLDSLVENSNDNSQATTLGEWLAHPSYTNVDGIQEVDAYIHTVYSQVEESVNASGTAFRYPRLYDKTTHTLDISSNNGVVGFNFYIPGDSIPEKILQLNTPLWAKTVIVVYKNQNDSISLQADTNALISSYSGTYILSKSSIPNLTGGVCVFSGSGEFNTTQIGIDTDIHVIGLYEDAQKLIVDSEVIDITYDPIPNNIEGTEYEDQAKWEFIGSAGGFIPHKGYIAAVILYEDDKFDQREEIHNYMNTLFGKQNYVEPAAQSLIPVIAESTFIENNYLGTGTASLGLPAGTESGDLLLIIAASDNWISTNETISAPEGYTKLTYKTDSTIDVHLLVFYKIADGTETSIELNHNFVFGNGDPYTSNVIAFALRITGNNLQNPSILWSSPSQYSSNFIEFPSTAVTSNNSLIIATAAYDGSDGDPYTISGEVPPWEEELTEYQEHIENSFAGLSLGYLSRALSEEENSTKTLRWTASSSDGWAGLLLQINTN